MPFYQRRWIPTAIRTPCRASVYPEPQVPICNNGRRSSRPSHPSQLRELSNSFPQTLFHITFAIIHHCRLTPAVLRAKYLPSFSVITWEHVFLYFAHTLSQGLFIPVGWQTILRYHLSRSRLLFKTYKELYKELQGSRRSLGDREQLENEAAIQLYCHPIPEYHHGSIQRTSMKSS